MIDEEIINGMRIALELVPLQRAMGRSSEHSGGSKVEWEVTGLGDESCESSKLSVGDGSRPEQNVVGGGDKFELDED